MQEEEELQLHSNSNIKLLPESAWCLSLWERLTYVQSGPMSSIATSGEVD
jgi:hypothetical protein